MGEPILTAEKIPTKLPISAESPSATYHVNGRDWNVTPIGTGNPHAVVFVSSDEFAELDAKLETIGPLFEKHEAFPAKTNTEFIHVVSEKEINFLVWERYVHEEQAHPQSSNFSV